MSGLGDILVDEDCFDTLVLGIGNLLWADEGFGVRVVEEIHRTHTLPPEVLLMDGGTQGLYLEPYVRRARNLLVFDAIDWGDEPGTLRVVRGEEVPAFMGCRKMSLHQTGFQDVLAAASLMGGGPEDIVLIGVQAVELEDWGGSLRPLIRDRMAPAIDLGLKELARWGRAAERRAVPLDVATGLVGNGFDIESYEAGGASVGAKG
ncbi:Hydrogenase maturation protease [Caenispirillum salinarum AK4]|uniref:Hydrogenase expression/formation protein HupD n=1 Tax=Caenispirillum salinarum AK4 TaxID=1238182 RepID=K9HK77_9PROT|nr:HyaD/HybD family hydrogenase maturation endopeptidase [Caenispirillum salinarum]EKV30753.1 Hydrogenase maturation protease [Caenispirillum salinarum AK4]